MGFFSTLTAAEIAEYEYRYNERLGLGFGAMPEDQIPKEARTRAAVEAKEAVLGQRGGVATCPASSPAS